MTRDAESTRRRILSVALALFRERGYERTTMRAVAKATELSLNAAYHHFEGKQDIVHALYAQQQRAHEEAAEAALAEGQGLRERLGHALHTALDVRAVDRPLMRELAPLVVGPDDATSAFSRRTSEIRERSIGLYRRILDDPAVPEDLRDVAALAFWALQMGVLLYFAHDESPRQTKTRALVDGALDLGVMVLGVLGTAPFAPLRAQLRRLLEDAELLP